MITKFLGPARAPPASTVALVKRAVRGAQELKGMDTALAVAGVLATTNTNVGILPLNLIVPGSGSWNREGRKCAYRSLRLFGSVAYEYKYAVTTGNLNGGILRMCVVWDKQPSGAAIPTFDTIFGHTLPDGTEACNFLDPLRYDNMGRFQLMADWKMTVQPQLFNEGTGSVDLTTVHLPFDKFVRVAGKQSVFSGQSAPQTIADISTGALYFIVRGNLSSDAVAQWDVNADSYARLRYIDA